MSRHHSRISTGVFADRVEDLKSETVLNYTLKRVLHLNDVLSTVEKKCTSRAFNIFNFPFPRDGDCCFASIFTELHKLLVGNDNGNKEFAGHLKTIGLGKSFGTDTLQLRLLFYQEIEKSIEKYSSFVDFNVKDENEEIFGVRMVQ